MSKLAPIDVIKLYAGSMEGFEDEIKGSLPGDARRSFQALKAHDKWNLWLQRCLQTQNLAQLMDVRLRLQQGMDEAVKKKMVTQQIIEIFPRWIGSIDRTARSIIKMKYPIPKDGGPKALAAKRKRDKDFEAFLLRSSY